MGSDMLDWMLKLVASWVVIVGIRAKAWPSSKFPLCEDMFYIHILECHSAQFMTSHS